MQYILIVDGIDTNPMSEQELVETLNQDWLITPTTRVQIFSTDDEGVTRTEVKL